MFILIGLTLLAYDIYATLNKLVHIVLILIFNGYNDAGGGGGSIIMS